MDASAAISLVNICNNLHITITLLVTLYANIIDTFKNKISSDMITNNTSDDTTNYKLLIYEITKILESSKFITNLTHISIVKDSSSICSKYKEVSFKSFEFRDNIEIHVNETQKYLCKTLSNLKNLLQIKETHIITLEKYNFVLEYRNTISDIIYNLEPELELERQTIKKNNIEIKLVDAIKISTKNINKSYKMLLNNNNFFKKYLPKLDRCTSRLIAISIDVDAKCNDKRDHLQHLYDKYDELNMTISVLKSSCIFFEKKITNFWNIYLNIIATITSNINIINISDNDNDSVYSVDSDDSDDMDKKTVESKNNEVEYECEYDKYDELNIIDNILLEITKICYTLTDNYEKLLKYNIEKIELNEELAEYINRITTIFSIKFKL